MKWQQLQIVLACAGCMAAWCATLAAAAEHQTADAPTPTPLRFAALPAEPVPLPPVKDVADSKPLSLAEVEGMALSFHPSLRQGEGQVRAARGQWVQVGLRPNPAIGYDGSEIGDDGRAGQQGGFVSQEFVTANKLCLNRAVALREVSAAEQRLERTRLQLITTVRIAYFEALAAERGVALARQLETMGTQAVKSSELRLQAQEGSKASLLQSQVESDTASLLVEQANGRRVAALRRLAAITGIDESAVPLLEDKFRDPLPILDWESARERISAESPELAELHAQVERAKCAVERASAGRVPNVNLQTGVQFDNATRDTIANVQFSVPLPVFDRNQGNIARACGELAAAQAALDERELALRQRLAAALQDFNTASRRVTKYDNSILPTARQSLELVTQAYDQGELDYLQLLSTQRTYTEKNLSYLSDLETAWKKWAEIDGLLVGTLPDGVDVQNSHAEAAN